MASSSMTSGGAIRKHVLARILGRDAALEQRLRRAVAAGTVSRDADEQPAAADLRDQR